MITTAQKLPIHVAFFTGYIPPYALPVFEEIDRRVEKLTVLLSTQMEANRHWETDFGNLDIRVQKTWTHFSKWKHEVGFSDRKQTHVPWDTYWQIRDLKPDILVSEELGYRSLFCGMYRALFRSPPLLLVSNLSEHTEKGRGRLRLWLRQWLARRAAATTANSKSGLRYLESIGFSKDELFLFPYTMPQIGFEELPLQRSASQSKHLICISELSQRKGIDKFIEGLHSWCTENPNQNIALDLFGSGDQEAQLKKLPTPANLKVKFNGHCDYEQVKAGIANSGILVFPTLADEWGLVVNEALAAGLPVLGSIYSQAVDELIEPGINGWVFDPVAGNLPKVLTQVFETPTEKIEQMRPQCRASVAERTPEWAAELFVTALRSVWESSHG
ncbi:MAG: glycosyltransferase family 4 protein [Planctomycetota bacterium]